MMFFTKPTISSGDTYNTCVSSTGNPELQVRLNAVSLDIQRQTIVYDDHARRQSLHLLTPIHGPDETVVLVNVKKGELKNLYSHQMVPKDKPAREIYDKIRASSPYGKCPFCGMGVVYTVDHYLPKTLFPIFSVTIENLVPSCRDCNLPKNNSYAPAAENQTLHPYYDHGIFTSDRWIHAEIVEATPVTVRFFVSVPPNWDAISKQRALTHFRSYDLAKRYGVESAGQITIVSDTLKEHYQNASTDAIQRYLMTIAESHQRLNRNSWQTALHWALAESEWYCGDGFNNSTM